jgi:hypothetical protein
MEFAPLCDREVCISTWLQADLTKLHFTVGSQMTRGCCDFFFYYKIPSLFFTSKCKQKFFVALKEEEVGWGELIRSLFMFVRLKIKYNISYFPTQFVCLIRVSCWKWDVMMMVGKLISRRHKRVYDVNEKYNRGLGTQFNVLLITSPFSLL